MKSSGMKSSGMNSSGLNSSALNSFGIWRQPLRSPISFGMLTLALLLAATASASAEGVLDYLPEDALGFVSFCNLESIDAKAQTLAELFEVPLPAPLPFMKLTTGLGEGLDTKGDVLVALLPGGTPAASPEPMVLLPISDYTKFADSIGGDTRGEICRVTIAGEDVLVGKDGNYALLMNIENRETLEILLELEPKSVAQLEPLDSWLANNDITVAIMPAGAKILLKLGSDGLAQASTLFEERASNTQSADVFTSTRAALGFYQTLLDFIGEEVELMTWGLSIDEDQNIRLGKRALLKKEGRLSQAGPISATSSSVFKGYADQPFVLAGGGPLPESWAGGLASASSKMIRKMKDFYGLEHLEESDWKELEQSYATMTRGLNSMSMIMLPGEEGEPLFSSFYGVMGVSHSDNYLKSYVEAAKTYNNIMSQSTRHKMEFEVQETTVADKQACELTMDIAGMMQDPNVPQFNWMLESMFGEEGKLRYLFVAASDNTLAISMGGEEKIIPLLKSIDQGEMGLAKNGEVETTMKLLNAGAPWKLLISPAGCVEWAERFANEFLGNLTGQTMDFPDFPTSPPLGITMHLSESRVESDLVWPAETLKTLAAYIKTCQEQ